MKNKHKLFINMAELIADQSTCCRMKVGAVLVKDSRVISIGYNGVASGQAHCEDCFKDIYAEKFAAKYPQSEEFFKSRDFFDAHGEFSNNNELHAEQNAILFAAKNGISTAGATVYVTWSPCINCAKVIVAAGIERVYFKELYDRSQEGIVFLAKNGIECRQLTEEEIK
ncbi:dCMP deaminase [Elusimicrobium simillimum]|uniref:deoxycytidylate deaminase n=1 Tax=Elusimicrobium simillimum TaxID=3143438 RepID=UPI003C6EC80F